MTMMIDFQMRCAAWALECFGRPRVVSVAERNYRFLEEALELVQSTGLTHERAVEIVDYVYGRPSGNTYQEVGGVMITLFVLCHALNISVDLASEAELESATRRIDQIREKNLNKPFRARLLEGE